MRVFWWQAGLHIEPENDADRAALTQLEGILRLSSLAGNPLTTEVSSTPAASPALKKEDSNSDGAALLCGDPSASVTTETLPNRDEDGECDWADGGHTKW